MSDHKLDNKFINQQVRSLFAQLKTEGVTRIAGQHMGDEYDNEIAVRLGSELRAAGRRVGVRVVGAGWFAVEQRGQHV